MSFAIDVAGLIRLFCWDRLPDEGAGQIPMAFVVRTPGSNLSEAEVMEFVAKQACFFMVAERIGVTFLMHLCLMLSSRGLLQRIDFGVCHIKRDPDYHISDMKNILAQSGLYGTFLLVSGTVDNYEDTTPVINNDILIINRDVTNHRGCHVCKLEELSTTRVGPKYFPSDITLKNKIKKQSHI